MKLLKTLCLTGLALAALTAGTAANAQGASADGTTGTDMPGSIGARDIQARDGDTFAAIARRELGRSGFANLLAEFNRMDVATELAAGQIVRIPRYVPLREESATVVFVKGTVTLGDEPLLRDTDVVPGDRIETGPDGFVSLEFSNGSVVNLQPGTSAQLTRLNCLPDDDSCLIEILGESGIMDADVQRRESQPNEFIINTPYASAAVRGTEFGFQADPSKLLVNVTEGDVGLTAAGESVDVPDGFGAVTEEGQPPSPPVPLLPPPVYRFVPVRVADGDLIELWSLTDSSGFYCQVATDIAGNEVTADFTTDNGSLELPAIDAGTYYLSVQGIDAQGLRGYSTSTRITVADIDADLPVVDTRISRQNQAVLVEVVDPPDTASGYEIQISETADFRVPITADVGTGGSALFRMDADVLYARARVLQDLLTVSAFGETAELR